MDKASKGFIKLDRAIFEHWIFQDAEKFKAFVDLIQLMRFRDGELLIGNEIVVVPRGSYYTSILKLADRWGWSRDKTRAFLTLLEKQNMIKVKSTTKGTMLTLENYRLYQDETPTVYTSNPQQTDNEKTSNRHQTDNESYTKEECKEREERKECKEREGGESKTYSQSLELCKYFSELLPGQNITQHLAAITIWIELFGFDWTKEAIQKCASNKNRFIKPWIEKVLKTWKSEGKEETKSGSTKQHIESEDREGIGLEF